MVGDQRHRDGRESRKTAGGGDDDGDERRRLSKLPKVFGKEGFLEGILPSF